MTDILADAAAFLATRLTAVASRGVTYARGPDSVDLYATFGKKLLKLDDGDGGIRMEWTDLDLIIPAADLVLLGEPIQPERGDLVYIVGGEGEGTAIYEVAAYGGEPPWRWCDPHRNLFRIHCKYVEMESYC